LCQTEAEASERPEAWQRHVEDERDPTTKALAQKPAPVANPKEKPAPVAHPKIKICPPLSDKTPLSIAVTNHGTTGGGGDT